MQRTRGGEPIDERDRLLLHRAGRGRASRGSSSRAKCAELGWFPLTALPDPVVPHELKVLHGIIAGELPAYTTFGF